MNIYKFKTQSRIKADAQIAGEVCEKLADQGNLTAKALVDVSRPEDAPLHGEFDWNDATAAESWREQQARHIISSLIIVTHSSQPVRAYFNIERQEPQYRHIETILKSPRDTELLLQTAMRELIAFRDKYASLEQLARVMTAIEELEKAS